MANKKNVKGNSFTWIQSFAPESVERVTNGDSLAEPLHVEIHPHHSSTELCNNSCPGCTGLVYRKQEIGDKGIKPERLIKTIDSFKGKARRVIFSGNCIEPLMYPEIKEVIKHIRESDVVFYLYSNFYYGNQEGLIEELVNTELDDYARISLNAGSNDSYNLVHRPKDTNSFHRIIENGERLARLKTERDSPLFVHVTYLLNNYNCGKEDLEFAVMWASRNKGINGIRFTTYQKPLGRSMPKMARIPEEDFLKARDYLHELKREFDRDDFKVEITNEQVVLQQKIKPFKRCYVQEVFAVIGFDGTVYPCTSMASPSSPEIYKFGNINQENFWDIWERRKRKANFSLEKCFDCTRAESEINSGFQGLREQYTSHV